MEVPELLFVFAITELYAVVSPCPTLPFLSISFLLCMLCIFSILLLYCSSITSCDYWLRWLLFSNSLGDWLLMSFKYENGVWDSWLGARLFRISWIEPGGITLYCWWLRLPLRGRLIAVAVEGRCLLIAILFRVKWTAWFWMLFSWSAKRPLYSKLSN
jgi:hypothetical protein